MFLWINVLLLTERARLGTYVILKYRERRKFFDHFLVEGCLMLQVEGELLRMISFVQLLGGLTLF